MGNEALISKKELLERYNISYGALYRWKRKGLIPDEWFIKKSTVTGQETFFPEKLVCERVELIIDKKEDVLLDELAKEISGEESKNEFIVLNTEFGEKSFRLCDVKGISIIDKNGEVTDIFELIKQKFDDLNEQVQKQNIKLPSVQDELNYLMNFPSDYGGLGDVFNDQYYENVNLFEKKCALQKLIPVERSGQMAVPLETPSNINITYRTNSNITNTTNSVPLNNYFPVSQGTFLYPTFPMNNQINLTSYAQMQMMYNRKQLLTGGNVASQGEKEGNGEGVQGAMNINRNANDSVRNVG